MIIYLQIVGLVCIQQAGACLQTGGDEGLPYFQGYEYTSCINGVCPGAPKSRVHHQHQAIITSYEFSCCGSITEWGVDLNPDSTPKFNFDFQVWRPSPTVNETGCFSLVGHYGVESATVSSKVVVVTPSVEHQLQFQPGDVLGFYVESHGSGGGRTGDADNGVVVLSNGSHTSELVWYGKISQQPSQFQTELLSCPYPVGTDGVLDSSTRAAPVISISVATVSCITHFSSLATFATSTSLPNFASSVSFTVPKPISTREYPTSFINAGPGVSKSGVLAGVTTVIVVVLMILVTIMIILVIVKRSSILKQTESTERVTISNQLYCIQERGQLNVTYDCPDNYDLNLNVTIRNERAAEYSQVECYQSVRDPETTTSKEGKGMHTGNQMIQTQVSEYAGVTSQYAEIGMEECRKTMTSENFAREKPFDVAGVYVPTTEEWFNLEDQTQSGNTHIYNKLTFFVEDETYWAPASTTSDLYSQLALKKYREIPSKKIKIITTLGSGEFGDVFKALWSTSGNTKKEVAAKTLKPGSSENDRVRFLQEAAIMGQFNHPHVVKLYGVVTVEDPMIICIEMMVNGNLRDYLGEISFSNCASMELGLKLLRFSTQIASGMAYLSKKAFVHRDLAARNILLDESLTCKISDFGMARDLADSTYYTVQSKGNKIPVKWTAPEALLYKKYSTDSDIWSYGMVLFEIWSVGKKPFSEISNKEVMRKVNSGYCQPPPPGCPRPIYQLMVNCWNPIHSQRPRFSEISASLNSPNSTLLQWTREDHSVHAGELGGQLEEAHLLYEDLQSTYL